jgi:hypothetical protein
VHGGSGAMTITLTQRCAMALVPPQPRAESIGRVLHNVSERRQADDGILRRMGCQQPEGSPVQTSPPRSIPPPDAHGAYPANVTFLPPSFSECYPLHIESHDAEGLPPPTQSPVRHGRARHRLRIDPRNGARRSWLLAVAMTLLGCLVSALAQAFLTLWIP